MADWILGFMSGTSMDGVDAALLRTDGLEISEFGPSAYRAFSSEQRRIVQTAAAAAAAAASPISQLGAPCDRFAAAAAALSEAHVDLGANLLARPGAPRPSLVGFHGQTLAHRPKERFTLQLGDASVLAKALGMRVAHDFRSADIAAGGQGAPLAPFFHYALARWLGFEEPVAFLNLGGVGNVTWVNPAIETPETVGALLAFDTGPANAQLDDWVSERSEFEFDSEGRMAGSGRARRDLIDGWIANCDYFAAAPPKSLDRQDMEFVLDDLEDLSIEDGAATLAAFSASSVARGAQWLPMPPRVWLVCGGGRKNPTLMSMLAEKLEAPVKSIDAVGLDGDMIEAQAFAYLAARVASGLPLSAPSTTGAPAPVIGGAIVTPG